MARPSREAGAAKCPAAARIIVRNREVRRLVSIEVEHHEARARKEPASLTNGTRIEQVAYTAGERDGCGSAADRQAASAPLVGPWVMRVPEHERRSFGASGQPRELGLSLRSIGAVLLWIVKRAVGENDSAGGLCLQGQPRQEVQGIVAKDRASPFEASARQRDTALVGEAPKGDQIVISRHGDRVEACHKIDAFVGCRTVANKIACTQICGDITPAQHVERRLERVQIAMNVG
jgi:hypothetical protein